MIALGTDDDGVTSYEVSGPTLGECPFCADRGPKFVSNPMMDETGADLWAVMCPACGATSPPVPGGPVEAVARYNMRGRPQVVN